jgi:hypothetical protein
MKIPAHIADHVRQALIDLPLNSPARAHGGIPLFFTLGTMLILRADGVILDLWPECEPDWPEADGEARVASAEQEWLGIVAASEKYPWLSELIPRRPPDATDCADCTGRGRVPTRDASGNLVTLFCGSCGAVGWRPSAL